MCCFGLLWVNILKYIRNSQEKYMMHICQMLNSLSLVCVCVCVRACMLACVCACMCENLSYINNTKFWLKKSLVDLAVMTKSVNFYPGYVGDLVCKVRS